MSGIAGILNLDGTPVERDLISRMTTFMSFRGPDAQDFWIKENVAFGHAMLRSTWEAGTEQQPLTLDGSVWLTADVRLDGRRELIAKLESKLGIPLKNPNDAELILHAYEAWKEDCVKHLLGDFSFAIWDARLERLFCARDQLGIRQFYYYASNDRFVFSNTLNCMRLHPRVSNTLNETAIGDFLVFGLNQEKETTAFADIQRLPKAHTLVVSRTGVRVSQYWTPSTSLVHYKNADDYVERFRELLSTAVTDRLRIQNVGISMSGGLDSSAIAAAAKRGGSTELSACCVVYDSVFPDEERKYATLVAEALDIPLELLDGNEINQQERSIGVVPEPFDVEPIYAVSKELLRRLSSHARVTLTGWDGDTFLNENARHSFARSLRRGNIARLFFDLIRFTYFQRSPPPVGIRTRIRSWRNPNWNRSPFPVWLNADFAERLNLVERWRETSANSLSHPDRPHALRVINSPSWDVLFSGYDAGTTLLPLEVRHPLIDLRMVDYLLALPIVPWLLDKRILRKAMVGILPDAVRQRPKSPLADDPGLYLRHSKKFQDIDQFQPVDALASYIDRKSIPRVTEETDRNQLWINVRPFSLNQWLTYSHAMEPTHDI